MGAIGVRRIVSRIYRWFRASWTFLTDLPVHFQASGKDLPSLPHRICEQGRLLFSSGITPTNYYRYRLYRRDEKGAARKFIVSGLPLCLAPPDAGRRLVRGGDGQSNHQSDCDPFEEL